MCSWTVHTVQCCQWELKNSRFSDVHLDQTLHLDKDLQKFLSLGRNGRLQDWHHGHLPRHDSEVCDGEWQLLAQMFYDCKHRYNICLEIEPASYPGLGSRRSLRLSKNWWKFLSMKSQNVLFDLHVLEVCAPGICLSAVQRCAGKASWGAAFFCYTSHPQDFADLRCVWRGAWVIKLYSENWSNELRFWSIALFPTLHLIK